LKYLIRFGIPGITSMGQEAKSTGYWRVNNDLEYLGSIAMTLATNVGMHSTVEVYVVMS
jgi:hypothetical protein